MTRPDRPSHPRASPAEPGRSRRPSAARDVSDVFPHVTEHVDDLPRQFAVDAREAEIVVRERSWVRSVVSIDANMAWFVRKIATMAVNWSGAG